MALYFECRKNKNALLQAAVSAILPSGTLNKMKTFLCYLRLPTITKFLGEIFGSKIGIKDA